MARSTLRVRLWVMIPTSLLILLALVRVQEGSLVPDVEQDLGDRFDIVIAPEIRQEVREAGPTARLVIFLEEITDAPGGEMAMPSLLRPQPILSWSLEETARAGSPEAGSVSTTASGLAWPAGTDELDGRFRARAVLKLAGTSPGPHSG